MGKERRAQEEWLQKGTPQVRNSEGQRNLSSAPVPGTSSPPLSPSPAVWLQGLPSPPRGRGVWQCQETFLGATDISGERLGMLSLTAQACLLQQRAVKMVFRPRWRSPVRGGALYLGSLHPAGAEAPGTQQTGAPSPPGPAQRPHAVLCPAISRGPPSPQSPTPSPPNHSLAPFSSENLLLPPQGQGHPEGHGQDGDHGCPSEQQD